MILEAAKSIAAANSALVKAASAAQRELIDQGKVGEREAYVRSLRINISLSLIFGFSSSVTGNACP
jgi:hypothetical protein